MSSEFSSFNTCLINYECYSSVTSVPVFVFNPLPPDKNGPIFAIFGAQLFIHVEGGHP
jgi:hypothetical protein